MLSQTSRHTIARVAALKTHSRTQKASYSSLRGKVVAISGAASGMGLATAKLLYPMGVKLSLADINKDALDKAVIDLKASATSSTGDIIAVGTDMSSSSQATTWIQTTVDKYGALDGAANFAGVLGSMAPLVETSDEEWSRIQSVNLFGAFFALRAQLRAMLERGNKGSIVNMASIAGTRAGYGPAAYSVSKHGVVGLTRCAAKEVGHLGIRVNVIAPGAIDTPMSRDVPPVMLERLALAQAATPLGRQGKAEEAAKLTAFLLSDESSYTTGGVHVLDGGLDT